jgi:hypothetical protein
MIDQGAADRSQPSRIRSRRILLDRCSFGDDSGSARGRRLRLDGRSRLRLAHDRLGLRLGAGHRRGCGWRCRLLGRQQGLERLGGVGVDRAAGVLERLDVAAHQHVARAGIDVLVEYPDDTDAQTFAGRLGRKIGLVHRIGAADADRHRHQRAQQLQHVQGAGEAGTRGGGACMRHWTVVRPEFVRIALRYQHVGEPH